ncbi:MAG: DUF4215 domain-containing protein, partial [Myxococcota bacterium]
VGPGEECDNGASNGLSLNACTQFCLDNICGDGHRGESEECDNGSANGTAGNVCTMLCLDNECGDGHVGGPEACDDGNSVDTDACRNDCTTPGCGDGIVTPSQGEQCDNGPDNGTPGNACTAGCRNNQCGDEHLGPGEQCDLGSDNGVPRSTCTLSCQNNTCGDGHLGPAVDEECDNGGVNGADGNACTGSCTNNICGDSHRGPGEGCDDGAQNGDGSTNCTSLCAVTICGDGYNGLSEACDDGNTTSFDGCRGDCSVAETLCHSIGYGACPTGRTEWCVATSDSFDLGDEAKIACEACSGSSVTCITETGGCNFGVDGVRLTGLSDTIFFAETTAGATCTSGATVDDQRGTDSPCPYGFWNEQFSACEVLEQVEFSCSAAGLAEALANWSSAPTDCP